jgi:hypothetical protein
MSHGSGIAADGFSANLPAQPSRIAIPPHQQLRKRYQENTPWQAR